MVGPYEFGRSGLLGRSSSPLYPRGVDPLRGFSAPSPGADRGRTTDLVAARPRTPTNAHEAERLAQTFELQLLRSTASIGADPAGEEADGSEGGDDAGGDEFGLGAIAGMDLMSMMAPALERSGASPAEAERIMRLVSGAAQQAGSGIDGLGAAAGSPDAAADASTGAAAIAKLLEAGAARGAAVGGGGGAEARGAHENAVIVAAQARHAGVDPVLAVAMMLVESGGNNRAVGDGGTSYGLFQLHEGGMLTAAGLEPAAAFDPAVNAGVALRSLAATAARHPDLDPGSLAAASQRPADAAGYAARVRSAMEHARSLLG